MASILIYFYIIRIDRLQNDHIAPSRCAPRRSRTLLYLSPVTPAIFGFVVVCLSVVLRPFKAAMYFFLLSSFVDQFNGRTDATAFPCTFRPGRLSPLSPLTQLLLTLI
jgi:hypothetical protein